MHFKFKVSKKESEYLRNRSEQQWKILTFNWKVTFDEVWNLEPVSTVVVRWT